MAARGEGLRSFAICFEASNQITRLFAARGFEVGFGFLFLLGGDFGVGFGVAFFLAKDPLYASGERFEVFGIFPDGFVVSQAHVHRLSFAVFLHPEDRDVIRLLEFGLGHVEAHQDAHFFRLPVLELVDLILDFEFVAPRLAGGMRCVMDRDCHRVASVPGVAVEGAADHVPKGLVVMEGIRRGVGADEAVAFGFEPFVEEIVERLLVDGQIAGGVEHYDVIVFELFLRKILFAVLGDVGAKEPRFDPELSHRQFGWRKLLGLPGYAPVFKAFALGDEKETGLGVAQAGKRQAKQHGECEKELCFHE
jgi:hypothetical protein